MLIRHEDSAMSHVRKDHLTASGEWKKHLRRWWSRDFWKRERKAAKAEANRQAGAPKNFERTLEDDFGEKFLKRRGSIDPDLPLER
jgi:hypothetical protein